MTLAVASVILVALAFDFVNGFHDAANSIATVVSTRVLSPRYAVVWAAFFNFIAFLVFETHVASTIGKGGHRCARHRYACRVRGTGGRDRLGSHQVVVRDPVELLSRADRRARRRRRRQGGRGRPRHGWPHEDRRLDRPLPAARSGAGIQ